MNFAFHKMRIIFGQAEELLVSKVEVGKSEGKRALGKSRCRWEDNIKFILIKYNGSMWSGLMRLRFGTSGWLFVCAGSL